MLAGSAAPKHLREGFDLIFDAFVVANRNNPVAAAHQLCPAFYISGSLCWLVVDGAVTENADVGSVEEVRDATGLGDGLLGLVGQAVEACGQGG